MAYKGKYTVKNPEKYAGNPNDVIYRSLWEKHCFKWADLSSDIIKWSSEEVVVPYLFEVDKRMHRYFVDMKIKFKDGRVLLIEIKPFKETQPPVKPPRKTQKFLNEAVTYVKNQNKWKAAKTYAEERGWQFQIWTERELEALGIMPKSRKGLPKLKPFPKKKSK